MGFLSRLLGSTQQESVAYEAGYWAGDTLSEIQPGLEGSELARAQVEASGDNEEYSAGFYEGYTGEQYQGQDERPWWKLW